MGLIPGVCGSLANGVYKSYTLEPLLVGELNFADEVVDMANQLAHDKSRPVWHIGSNGVDDGVGEVGIKAMLASVLVLGPCLSLGIHCECVNMWEGWVHGPEGSKLECSEDNRDCVSCPSGHRRRNK